jgi:hypothetical protein
MILVEEMKNDLLFLLIMVALGFVFGFLVGSEANRVHKCMIRAEYQTADGPDEAYCKAWDEFEKQKKRKGKKL